tara:strand:+ start:402 stop:566 length:165 start_codon:yes stop_codon:yes gene_type:complete
MSNQFKITGSYIDPYTYEVKPINQVVKIRNENSAIKWAKQTFYKATINKVEKIN